MFVLVIEGILKEEFFVCRFMIVCLVGIRFWFDRGGVLEKVSKVFIYIC